MDRASFCCCCCCFCPRFIENITAQQKDSNSSTWCFEVHPNFRLSDLQVGQTAKVQELQHFLSVRIYFNDFLIQGWDLRDVIVSPLSLSSSYSLMVIPLTGPLWICYQICDLACDLIAELLAGNNGNFLTHLLVDVEVIRWIYLEISFWFSASVIHLCSPFPGSFDLIYLILIFKFLICYSLTVFTKCF